MKQNLFPAAAGLALLLSGCATSPQFQSVPEPAAAIPTAPATPAPASRTELLQPPTELFTLGPGDRLDIELIGVANSRTATTVGPDGKIYYHLLHGQDVWGLTLAQTKTQLEKELAKYISEPQVAITLRAVGSKSVWLLGRFAKPGIYPMAAPMTLIEAFALAGGTAKSVSTFTTEDLGDLRHSFVVRAGKPLPVDLSKLLNEGDMSHNIYLKADDLVYVPPASAREIYVLGAVRAPRAVPYHDNVTVISAVANAYGTIKDAYLSHVAVVRGSMANPQISIVDYRAIVTGKSPDVKLEPHDIVYVPFSPYRTLTKYLEIVLATFVNTVAANEGTLVVNPDALPITPTVPVGN